MYIYVYAQANSVDPIHRVDPMCNIIISLYIYIYIYMKDSREKKCIYIDICIRTGYVLYRIVYFVQVFAMQAFI